MHLSKSTVRESEWDMNSRDKILHSLKIDTLPQDKKIKTNNPWLVKSNSPWAGGKVGINLVAKVEWYHFVPYINTKKKICDSLAIGVAFRFYE